MHLQILSDLHLETHPNFRASPAPGANLLVLAGDIGSYQRGSLLPDGDYGLAQFSPQQANYRRMAAYGVVNVRTGVTFDNIEFSIYANNLLDDNGVIRALAASPFDPEARIRTVPRTIGANVRMNF